MRVMWPLTGRDGDIVSYEILPYEVDVNEV